MPKRSHPSCEECAARSSGVFCDLDKQGLEAINLRKTHNRYKKGQIIFYDGNHAFGVFCVLSGKVKLYKSGADGHPQIVRLASAGSLLGHRALLSDEPYQATAEALEDCDVCCIDRNTFLEVTKGNQDLTFKLLRKLSQELRTAENLAASLAQKSARERMAELLTQLQKAYGKPAKQGIKIDLHLTREDIGEMIGMTQETAIRLLSEFKKDKIISVQDREITILKSNALLDIAGIEV